MSNTSIVCLFSAGADHVKHKFPKDMTVVNEISQVGNNFRLKASVSVFPQFG